MTPILSPEKIALVEPAEPLFMTFEEFLEWDDEHRHAEWVNGKVIFLSATTRHQRVLYFLLRLIGDWLEFRGDAGTVLPAPWLMRPRPGMPGREPDVMYVSEANAGRIREKYVEGAADLVVEIVSPESVHRDHIEKFAEYETGGVGEYWIIDPLAKTAEFYVRDAGSPYFRRGAIEGMTPNANGVYTCELLDGLRIDADWLFAEPLPPMTPIRRAWETPVPAPMTPASVSE